MKIESIQEDKIIKDFMYQIKISNFKDEEGHYLIDNDAFIKFLNLWLETEFDIDNE